MLALSRQELLDLGSDVALQLSLGRHAFLLHKCLTIRTFSPSFTWSFIAADMDHVAREQFADLFEDIAAELPCSLFSDAHHVLGNAPLLTHLIRSAGTAEPRIACECSHAVTRDFNLRNGDDMSVLCIFHDFTNLVLGVESAIRALVVNIALFP